jgi:L-seryl-tRNA(Ser) seleniumtransferase
VDQLLQAEGAAALVTRYGRSLVVDQIRRLMDGARARAATGDEPGLREALGSLVGQLGERLKLATEPSLIPLINATGVVLHTNLGRAPLSPAAARRVSELAASYSNLELDLAAGERGNREIHAEVRLRTILGAEATAVVNNNAAAVFLTLNTLAEGREVIVSRGELVEIGGSFRIPDVLRKSGARLREVGTTNRTRLSDYQAALGPETALILRVHTSNYRIVGFTEAPRLEELAGLAREAAVPLVEDLGSGLLTPLPGPLATEPTVAQALEAGVVVTWSGDKLLGGPQAGLVAGRSTPIHAMRRNPLYRALRVDKMTLGALDAVLADYQQGRASRTVPVQHMLALDVETVRSRAEDLVRLLGRECPTWELTVTEGFSTVGGGAAPTTELPTALVSITHPSRSAGRLAARLRTGHPPVVPRVADGRLLLDLRTVPPEQDETLARAVVAAAG